MKKLILASKNNAWSSFLFDRLRQSNEWSWVKDDCELSALDLDDVSYIFFFHWSTIVPRSIHEKCKCVVIHTANLPKGRGGSPLQNQIMEGVVQTRVNLLEMTDEVDAGPIYCSGHMSLQGSLFDIWMSIASISSSLIEDCVFKKLQPSPQNVLSSQPYRRRKDNLLPLDCDNIHRVYQFIQMLDAEGYPSAHVDMGKYTLSFSRAQMSNENEVLCDVRISKNDE